MIEIHGKVSTARCYAKTLDEKAAEQIRRMCDYALTEGAKVRIMPDVHAGKGCTIGTTMTVKEQSLPEYRGRGHRMRDVHRETEQYGAGS